MLRLLRRAARPRPSRSFLPPTAASWSRIGVPYSPVATRIFRFRSDHVVEDFPEFFAPGEELLEASGLGEAVQERLRAAGVHRPSQIQALSWPRLLEGEDVVITSETGSGKTLAYLAPIMDRLYHLGPENLADPFAAIMVPTQELALQVLNVISSTFPEVAPYTRPAFLNIGPGPKDPFALLVGTPHAFKENISEKRLRQLRTLVLDEADMLLVGQFASATRDWLLAMYKMQSASPQHVFCAATLPGRGKKSVRAFLDRYYPAAIRVSTQGAHRVNPRLQRTFIALSLDESLYSHEAAERLAAKVRSRTHPLDPTPTLHDVLLAEQQLQLQRSDAIKQQKFWLLLEILSRGAEEKEEEDEGLREWNPAADELETEALALGLEPALLEATLEPDSDASAEEAEEEEEEEGRKRKKDSRRPLFAFRDWSEKKPRKHLPKQVAQAVEPTLVFTQSSKEVEDTIKFLARQAPTLRAVGLHAGMRENQRASALRRFGQGDIQVLVTTDVAARGLDTTHVAHVVQFDFASDALTHLHRVGRTGRMGREGRVTSIVAPDNQRLARTLWLAEATGTSIEAAFGRRRGLKRRLKRAQAVMAEREGGGEEEDEEMEGEEGENEKSKDNRDA